MNKDNDNVMKKGKMIIGSTLREKLKTKLKEIIRKKMTEISTTSAAGGGGGDGSAGPVKTPHAFGKVKDPTTGLDGYTQVGKNETGTINEKEGKKSEKSEKEPPKKEPEPEPYKPIVQNKELDPKTRLKKMEKIKQVLAAAQTDLTKANTDLDTLYRTRKQAVKASKKSD